MASEQISYWDDYSFHTKWSQHRWATPVRLVGPAFPMCGSKMAGQNDFLDPKLVCCLGGRPWNISQSGEIFQAIWPKVGRVGTWSCSGGVQPFLDFSCNFWGFHDLKRFFAHTRFQGEKSWNDLILKFWNSRPLWISHGYCWWSNF